MYVCMCNLPPSANLHAHNCTIKPKSSGKLTPKCLLLKVKIIPLTNSTPLLIYIPNLQATPDTLPPLAMLAQYVGWAHPSQGGDKAPALVIPEIGPHLGSAILIEASASALAVPGSIGCSRHSWQGQVHHLSPHFCTEIKMDRCTMNFKLVCLQTST